MKKLFDFLGFFTFCVIVFIPSISLFINYKFVNLTDEVSRFENEKRDLAEWPTIRYFDGDFEDYTASVGKYLEDRIIFRTTSLSFITNARFHFLGLESGVDAIIGHKGWLFFRRTISNTIGLADTNLSDDHLLQWVDSALKMKQRVEKNGGVFVIVVPPDKAQVYPEYLGKQFTYASDKRLMARLKPLLEKKDILIIDLLGNLSIHKKRFPERLLYSKTDTHWTHKGALNGYHTIISELNLQSMNLKSVDEINLKKGFHNDFSGDLAQLLGLTAYFKESREILDPMQSFNIFAPTKTLLIYGDSFSGRMMDFWRYSFKNVQCFHHNAGKPNMELVEETNADVVILQIIERSLTSPLTLGASGASPCV